MCPLITGPTQALLNLAGTYGCVNGYPDGSFQGEAAITRYEFVAGMDACLSALTGFMEQQNSRQQEVDALIEAMEQSLEELRGLDQKCTAARGRVMATIVQPEIGTLLT